MNLEADTIIFRLCLGWVRISILDFKHIRVYGLDNYRNIIKFFLFMVFQLYIHMNVRMRLV